MNTTRADQKNITYVLPIGKQSLSMSTYMGYTKRTDGSWNFTRWGPPKTLLNGKKNDWSHTKPPSPIRTPPESPHALSPVSSSPDGTDTDIEDIEFCDMFADPTQTLSIMYSLIEALGKDAQDTPMSPEI